MFHGRSPHPPSVHMTHSNSNTHACTPSACAMELVGTIEMKLSFIDAHHKTLELCSCLSMQLIMTGTCMKWRTGGDVQLETRLHF